MNPPRRGARRLLGTLALLLGAVVPVLTVTAAGAISYTPPAIETKPCAAPNESMTLNGSGFVPGATVVVALAGTSIGSTTVAPDGSFSFAFRAPSITGSYEIAAGDGTNSLTTTFRVDANCGGGGGGGGGRLPYTGSSSTSWLVPVGVGLLAVGTVLVAAVRSPARRRRSEHAHVDA